jgi:hypothetical protein
MDRAGQGTRGVGVQAPALGTADGPELGSYELGQGIGIARDELGAIAMGPWRYSMA